MFNELEKEETTAAQGTRNIMKTPDKFHFCTIVFEFSSFVVKPLLVGFM